MSHNAKLGLYNNVRSPGSIANAEHYDNAGAGKSINASPCVIKSIPTPTSLTPIHNYAVVRICNTGGPVAFFWAGRIDQVPGTLDITSALAIEPGTSEVLLLGASDDDQLSMAVKASSSSLQIVIMQE